MALLAPNPLLAVDTITTDPRTTVKGQRGDLSYADAGGTTYPAIVTQQTAAGLRLETMGQPIAKTNWDILIFIASDPLVKKDHNLQDQNGRILTSMGRSVQRETGCYYVQAQELA